MYLSQEIVHGFVRVIGLLLVFLIALLFGLLGGHRVCIIINGAILYSFTLISVLDRTGRLGDIGWLDNRRLNLLLVFISLRFLALSLAFDLIICWFVLRCILAPFFNLDLFSLLL